MEEEIKNIPDEQPAPEPAPKFLYFPFFNRMQAAFVLFLLAIVFYSPSFYNEQALDDGILIHQNNLVLKGIKGIGEIMTRDAYHSFYERMHATDQLQGGRYRPLPSITYAIEQEIIKPYRTGYYQYVEDSNKNGILECNESEKCEFNTYVDMNGDGQVQPEECSNCWDLNYNFKDDFSEDLNEDGVFNEVDCQTYGSAMRHFNNILLYALMGLLVYLVFSTCFFVSNQDLAFLAALIYVIHPVHSEAVANIRGRDDIFSMIFIMLAFYYSLQAIKQKTVRLHFIAAAMLFLGLLSKEYALLLFLFVPLSLFVFSEEKIQTNKIWLPALLFVFCSGIMIYFDIVGFYLNMHPALCFGLVILVFIVSCIFLFKDQLEARETSALMIYFFMAGIIYIGLRLNAVNMAPKVPDTEILNNPYLLASGTEAFATKIYTLLIYLRLMVFPHPLVADYSYGTIPYRSPGSWDFILSLILNLALLIVGLRLLMRRHPLGFAIIFYLVFLIVVSNLFFPTGIMMLENFIFHASLGFAIALGWCFIWILDRMKNTMSVKRSLLIGVLSLLIILSGIKAWERSMDWKNDVTLFLKDVKNAPNSVLILGNAGARWIDLADTREITGYNIPGQDSTRFNDYNGTLVITNEEMKEKGYATKKEAALNKGIDYLKHAVELHPRYVNGFLNLGLANFKLKKDMDAILYWKIAEHLYPENPYLQLYYQVYSGILKSNGNKAFAAEDFKLALHEFKKWTVVKPTDHEAWFMAGGAYYHMNQPNDARRCWEKALILNPNYEEAKKALAVAPPYK